MPDSQGNLTEEEKKKAQEWIRDKWKNFACPYSGHTEWDIGETIAQATAFQGGGLSIGGRVYPLIVVTCRGCGNTVFINAIKAGIVSKGAKPDAGQ